MIPILTDSYPVVGHGLGGLNEAIDCVVTHEINGEYELMLQYPITGQHYGHPIVRGGRTVGQARAFPHIDPAERDVIKAYETALKKVIQDGT